MEIHECPVSFITDESTRLVQVFTRASIAHEAAGASLYGQNLSKWPAWAVDALTALESEQNKIEIARHAREHFTQESEEDLR